MDIDDPFAPRKRNRWLDAAILACVLIVGFGGILLYAGTHSDATSANDISPEDACRDNWVRCKDNSMLVNNWRGIDEARDACKQAADLQAKWGHPEFSSMPFSKFQPGNDYVPAAELLLIDDGGGFYNAFDALQRMEMECGYDLKANKVVDFVATPRN